MEFPQTQAEMITGGYKYSGGGTCKACQNAIEWWKTPRGKSIPMEPMSSDASAAIAHWTTCTSPDSFRKPASAPEPRVVNPTGISDDDIPF